MLYPKQRRHGLAPIESILMIAVAAIILLGILQFAQSIAFLTSQRVAEVLDQSNAESEQRSNYGEPSRDTTTTGKHPESTGYKDPNDASFRNPTELGKLRTSEGELDPEYLNSRSERETAYGKWDKILKDAGLDVGFAGMAEDVTDDLAGIVANHAEFGDATEEFLEFGNWALYSVNDRMFNKLLDDGLFDPTAYVDSLKTEQLGRAPATGFEFDLQMVKTEQRVLEGVVQRFSESPHVTTIMKEINNSLQYHTDFQPITFLRYWGGRLLAYESKAVYMATNAIGHNVDFRKESNRRAIGFAAAFLEHGYSEDEYYEYMRTGKLP
ncbi:MAG: hypothetical protein R3C28_26625 [Pirellulaceae bacterium]